MPGWESGGSEREDRCQIREYLGLSGERVREMMRRDIEIYDDEVETGDGLRWKIY